MTLAKLSISILAVVAVTCAAAIAQQQPASSDATPASSITGTGTANYLPLWTSTSALGNSILFQSGTGPSARIGINTTSPIATLNVKGTTMMQGSATMASAGIATTSAGTNSFPLDLRASVFNSSTHAPANQNFQWMAEPTGNNTSNPSASLNLLFGQGTSTPTETGLRIASNGVITFAAGQKFPGGAGTVTSVGLSAPSSDFTVGGSPVTSSGALNLNWVVPPGANNVANSIVKRDASGSFVANAAGFSSVLAANSVANQNTVVITGQSLATGVGPTYGVYGTSATSQGAGVVGRNDNTTSGYGVLGLANNSSPAVAGFNYKSVGGVGVFGAGDWGFYTDNNVHQGMGGNGWVKAMLVYDDIDKKTMLGCFNSTLSGPAATTPPCGFKTAWVSTGEYSVDFGFNLGGRFVSATSYLGQSGEPTIVNLYFPSFDADEVNVTLWAPRLNYWADGIFALFVF